MNGEKTLYLILDWSLYMNKKYVQLSNHKYYGKLDRLRFIQSTSYPLMTSSNFFKDYYNTFLLILIY